MPDSNDLALMLASRTPLVVVETHEEPAFMAMLRQVCSGPRTHPHRPLFRWSVTDGLQRLDGEFPPQTINSQPQDVLRHVRAVDRPGVYALLDLHPYLDNPVHVRLLKGIALAARDRDQTVVLVSHALRQPPGPGHVPGELQRTRPLSVTMAERVDALRAWARDRTVPCD